MNHDNVLDIVHFTDIDGNGEWDPYELEAIFKKEVEDLFEG